MPKHSLSTDPEDLATKIVRESEDKVLILGLDLGTSCGYAYTWHKPGTPVATDKVQIICGQWDLSSGPYDSGAIRFVRLRQFLSAIKPDATFYEMVRNTPAEAVTKYNAAALLARAATSAQLFGAFQGHVCAWCEEKNVPCTSFPIQTIKKRATGKGNANKLDVINAANKAFGLDLDPEGYEGSGVDNIADAAWVCMLGVEQYGYGVQRVERDNGD